MLNLLGELLTVFPCRISMEETNIPPQLLPRVVIGLVVDSSSYVAVICDVMVK